MLGQYSADLLFLRQIREQAKESHQHPVSMNRRVPVETAIKGRMHSPWSLNVTLVIEYIAGFVGIFFADTFQGQLGETRRFFGLHRSILLGRRGGIAGRGTDRQRSGGG